MAKRLTTFWQQHVSQWRSSGLTQAQYCKKHELNPQRLSHHKRKLETKGKQPSKTSFIAIPVPKALPKSAPLTLHFSSGLSLSGIAPNNIDVVKQLTAALL
tara:strand:+ start:4647 stop:4949 length:303 start_codon:yes stop_codon:yes gene_type:complete